MAKMNPSNKKAAARETLASLGKGTASGRFSSSHTHEPNKPQTDPQFYGVGIDSHLPTVIDLLVAAAVTKHLGGRLGQMDARVNQAREGNGPGYPPNYPMPQSAQVPGPAPKQVYILPLTNDEARSMMKGVDEAWGRWRVSHEKIVALPPTSPDYLSAMQELYSCWMDFTTAADRFVQFMRPV